MLPTENPSRRSFGFVDQDSDICKYKIKKYSVKIELASYLAGEPTLSSELDLFTRSGSFLLALPVKKVLFIFELLYLFLTAETIQPHPPK